MKHELYNDFNALALRQLKENWGWYCAFGIGLIALGILAIMYSFKSTLLSVVYLGAILIAVGIVEFFQSFKLSKWSSFFFHVFLGVLYAVAGWFILMHPAINALTLTLLLAAFFIVAGIFRMIFSIFKNVPHRFWLFLNGALTLILGILIWQQWPVSGLWVIGTFVGIDAIFTGWTWVMLSLKAKELPVA